ncbi:iron-containing alcohol dehydrogenase [Clostridium aminobutyricum]|uniref:Iron-containing alcohol dehydrogenase n=1 Tax=Clostridium aminobutyricum TaxID=33953 RepID=A0A939D9F1_CLOAM|nr:iron-containing alcohol dehydrogenase [Clostridium aminobutyricum]MBN7773497.1 iron-containing alcohol dehydrogenase [Clostridium aminobutyricum]
MNSFIYDIPTRVYFGENQLGHLGKELSKYGKRVLMVYGGGSIKSIGLYDKVVAEIKNAGLELFECSGIEPNPRVTSVNRGATICKKEKIDVLLAVGGGSTIDATKFIGAATYYEGDAWDILTRKTRITKSLPIVSILTLSATGSEMDAAGVISNMETKDKIGLMHPALFPRVSFLDPTNTYTVDAYQTACGAADILSHIMEVYFNRNQDLYMLDCVMEGLMKTVIKYTPIALTEPDNYEARANLMWASSWAINGFINGGKRQAWSCHPMEHELSAIYDITHGLGLAILTPRWLEYTLDETTVSKFYQFGVNVFDIDKNAEPMEVAKKSMDLLSDFLFNTLGLQRTFTEIGIDDSNFSIMAEKACGGSVLPGFKPLNQKDIENIFSMCL